MFKFCIIHTVSEASRSYVGVQAQDVPGDEPTMWLNLSTGGDDYKKYLVVHEFGHALGLDDEHQRLDFWQSIKKYVDIDKMKKDIQGNIEWLEDANFYSDDRQFTQYDASSVMHYW